MRKHLIIILFLLTWKAESQPLVTDGKNNKILQWDSSYQVETTEFSPGTTIYQYIIKREGKILAQYFRYDDSSFLFVMSDSLKGKHEEGLLKLSINSADQYIISIPDFSADPDGSKGYFKDSILVDIGYRKTGRWKETDNLGNVFTGRYVDGNKDSIWEEGKLIPTTNKIVNDYAYYDFVPSIKHLYKNGAEISFFKDTSFWPKLKGKWFPTLISIDSHTEIFSRQELGKIYLNFENENSFSSLKPSKKSSVMHSLERYTAEWKQNGDLIEITESNKTKVLQILSLTEYQLIVRFLK